MMPGNDITWTELSLDDVASFQNGGAWKESEYEDSGVPVVRVTNCKGGTIDLNDCKYLNPAYFEKYSKHELSQGDVVIATVGSHPTQPNSVVGRSSIIPRKAAGSLLNQNAVRLRAKKGIFNQRLLGYISQSGPFKRYIAAHARGAASQVRMSIELLKKMPVKVPPLATQESIASILSNYDDLIENNTRRIQILEVMARRLYEEWFVHFRFPGHEEVSFKASELGEIPVGWEVISLESFGTILTGKTPSKKKPELFGSEVPFIKLPDMHDQIFITGTNEALSREGEETQKKKTVPANSICVSCIGTGGIVVITSEPSQTNQQINTVVPARSDLREFLYFSALSLRDDINNYGATGATMTNLSRGKFASLKVIAPREEMMSSYSKLAAPMFDRILNLQRANRNLRAQRDLLLPKLVSGEIDVSDIPMPNDQEDEAA